MVEELRKILVALWQGNKTAISPESLFTVVWKVVPRFRYGPLLDWVRCKYKVKVTLKVTGSVSPDGRLIGLCTR